jgi:hypothetical protein
MTDSGLVEAAPTQQPLGSSWIGVPLGRVVVFHWLQVLFYGLLFSLPTRPRTAVGWALAAACALVFAVPVALVLRRFGNPLFNNPTARRLAARTDQNASSARVAYLLSTLPLIGAAVLVWWSLWWAFSLLLAPFVPGLAAYVSRQIY